MRLIISEDPMSAFSSTSDTISQGNLCEAVENSRLKTTDAIDRKFLERERQCEYIWKWRQMSVEKKIGNVTIDLSEIQVFGSLKKMRFQNQRFLQGSK